MKNKNTEEEPFFEKFMGVYRCSRQARFMMTSEGHSELFNGAFPAHCVAADLNSEKVLPE